MRDDYPRLHLDPTSIELTRQVKLKEFADWVIEKLGGYDQISSEFIISMDEENLTIELSQLLIDRKDGDTLWLGRSRERNILYGNEGLCLVRDGMPIRYHRVVDY